MALAFAGSTVTPGSSPDLAIAAGRSSAGMDPLAATRLLRALAGRSCCAARAHCGGSWKAGEVLA